jgi:pilus assembly protein FimV
LPRRRPLRRRALRRPRRLSLAPAPASTDESSGDTVKVRRGDTLTAIALAKKESGVSLDQMLVSLFRNNPQAFIDDNMNRMKSGVTLAVPGAETAKQLSNTEARQIIQAQSADFAAYRQRLAGSVPNVKTDEGTRQASGKVEAKIHDQKTAAAPTAPEKLTLSQGTAKPGTVHPGSQGLEGRQQRQADAARVAELSRNVAELKKLSGGAPAATPAATPAPAPALPGLTVARTDAGGPGGRRQARRPAPAIVASTATPAAKPPVVATLPRRRSAGDRRVRSARELERPGARVVRQRSPPRRRRSSPHRRCCRRSSLPHPRRVRTPSCRRNRSRKRTSCPR